MRRIVFAKYFNRVSELIGADQMSEALRARGLAADSLPVEELGGVRGALVVFIKKVRLPDLLRAKLAGNRVVIDVQDTIVFRRLRNARLADGIIFRNHRACRDFGRAGRASRVIYQHWDPRLLPQRVPAGEARVAYLGDPRSIGYWRDLPGVEWVTNDQVVARSAEFNVHLSVRQPGRESLYKPNTKVATAAGCGAVLLTTRDESALELLGPDYPFYSAGDRESLIAALAGLRRAPGGGEWGRATAILERLRERLAIGRIAGEYLEFFSTLG